ncbi:MAG: hypothetical protein ACOYNC_12245 [Bacteroidales bacterium]
MKSKNQHRFSVRFFLVLVGSVVLSHLVTSQTLRVNINVNSTVGMQQTTPFEIIPENEFDIASHNISSQAKSINSVGAFTITGKENTDILIHLETPEVLINKQKQSMPFSMNMAWQNKAGADVRNIRWSDKMNNVFQLRKNLADADDNKFQDDDLQAYLYLKSTAEVPANAESPFEGNIRLTIEY